VARGDIFPLGISFIFEIDSKNLYISVTEGPLEIFFRPPILLLTKGASSLPTI
jgi:hypothetical protein